MPQLFIITYIAGEWNQPAYHIKLNLSFILVDGKQPFRARLVKRNWNETEHEEKIPQVQRRSS